MSYWKYVNIFINACDLIVFVQVFKLTRSKVDDDKSRILIQHLLDHPSLVELNLSHNLIADRGARAIGKLINRSKMVTLNICDNRIRAQGAQAIAHALSKNSILMSLNFRLNCIEDEGGQAICHALLLNSTLTTLHLGGNELSEPTATLFSQVLAQNTTLSHINLSCNHIGLVGNLSEMGVYVSYTVLRFLEVLSYNLVRQLDMKDKAGTLVGKKIGLVYTFRRIPRHKRHHRDKFLAESS